VNRQARPSGGLERARAWILLGLAAILPYLPCLWNGFVFDDQGLILDNQAVSSRSPAAAWSGSYWPDNPRAGLYRPVTTFSYWIDARLFHTRPAGFHAVNLALHLATTLLLWRLLLRLFPERAAAAFLAACLLAVHPLRSEAVAWAVGRSELLAAFFGVLAYFLAVRYGANARPAWLLGSGGALWLALLSKESAVGLCLLPLFHIGLLSRESKGRWRSVLFLWLLPIAFTLVMRIRVLGSLLAIERVSLSDNVLAHVPAWTRAFAAMGFQWIFLLKLLAPVRLSPDYSYPQLLPTAGWIAGGALFLLAAGALAAWALRRRDRPLLWGLSFALAAGVLTSNILLPIGTVLAERLTYLPSVGAIWILAERAQRWSEGGAARSKTAPPGAGRGRRRWPVLALALWGLALGARTFARTLDWKSDVTLFRAAVETSPRSARVRTNQAHSLRTLGRLEDAVEEGRRALALLPGYPPAAVITSACLNDLGRTPEAVALVEPVVRAGARDAALLLELGNSYLSLQRGGEAEATFAQAARLLPRDDPRPAVGRASSLAVQSRWREAAGAWQNAVSLSPADLAVRRNWAYALWQAGSPDSAETVYRGALENGRDDPACLNDLAWFLVKSGRAPAEAVALARRAFARRPDSGTADTLLEALLEAGGCRAARPWADSLGRSGRSDLGDEIARRLEERCADHGGGEDAGKDTDTSR
jgi:tetratricopeptide (TPR) repeat protein